jgi:methionyl-tRNA synthetase
MPFYITTPIYYVNAAPHLGHAYTTIAADVMARHMRSRGEDVFFLTGTDEHGEPVAQVAEREGISPQELADRNAERFRALTPVLDATNDFFIRTSDPEHEAAVQRILERVKANGHVYEGIYEGWYCPSCADFKTEAEVGPENTCLIHYIPLLWEREQNWFFRLTAFTERLQELFRERPDFVMPAQFAGEARSFIAGGLQDVSLTRARLRWGVSVPWDPEQVFYVWWDALLNYVTALTYARPGEDLTSEFWPATFHLVGKDILKFHTIYWPALLMAADLEVPRHVFVHGFLLGGDGRKMSKSLGNVLDPFEIIEGYGIDALRHYLLREVSFGSDGKVSVAGFLARYESELANELGNLASRTTAMIGRYRGGELPVVGGFDLALAGEIDAVAGEVAALLDRCELTQALEAIWLRVRRLNRYVEERAPWVLARDPSRAGELDEVLASLAEGVRVVAVLLLPYLPSSCSTLLDALGARDRSFAAARFGGDPGATGQVSTLEPLFPKRDRAGLA